MKMPFEALKVTSRVSYCAKMPRLVLKAFGLSPVAAMKFEKGSCFSGS